MIAVVLCVAFSYLIFHPVNSSHLGFSGLSFFFLPFLPIRESAGLNMSSLSLGHGLETVKTAS